jgi:hypothetical protein
MSVSTIVSTLQPFKKSATSQTHTNTQRQTPAQHPMKFVSIVRPVPYFYPTASRSVTAEHVMLLLASQTIGNMSQAERAALAEYHVHRSPTAHHDLDPSRKEQLIPIGRFQCLEPHPLSTYTAPHCPSYFLLLLLTPQDLKFTITTPFLNTNTYHETYTPECICLSSSSLPSQP